MSLLIILLLIGTIVSTAIKVGILFIGAKTYRERRRSTTPSAATNAGRSTLRTQFNRWFRGEKSAAPVPEPERVLAWVRTTLASDIELRAWLAALGATEAQAVAREVAAFCDKRQLALPQLVEPPFANFPQLQTRLGAVALAYCRARRAAQAFPAADQATK